MSLYPTYPSGKNSSSLKGSESLPIASALGTYNRFHLSQACLLRLAITQFNKNHDFGFDAATLRDINKTIFKEYLDESQGRVTA